MSLQEISPLFADNGPLQRINCSDCVALCCRKGTVLSLSGPEAVRLTEAGTDLVVLEQPTTRRFLPILNKPGKFGLQSDCANLQTVETGYDGARCGDYENRPDNCTAFEAGGLACRMARVSAGIDSQQSLDQYKMLTAGV